MPESIEYVVREFNDRGLIWLLESSKNLEHFIRLFASELAERLDFSRLERLPRSFISSELEKTETDVLFRLPVKSGNQEVLIYLLNELQSASDNEIGLKIYSRRNEIWKQERRVWMETPTPRADLRLRPVVPLVFYTGESRWNFPEAMEGIIETPEGISEFNPRWRTLFIWLHGESPEVLLKAGNGLALALRGLQSAGANLEEMKTAVAEVTAGLSELSQEEQGEWTTAMRFLLLLIRHKRARSERELLYGIIQSAVDKRHREEVNTMIVTDADLLRQEGKQEGRQEGRQESLRDLLILQLQDRFGTLPDRLLDKVRNLGEKEGIELGIRLIHAESIDQLGL